MTNQQAGETVAFCQPAVDLTGSAHSGLYLAQGMVQAGLRVHAIFPKNGPIVDRYRNAGCEVHFADLGAWLNQGEVLSSTLRLAREVARSRNLVHLFRRLRPALVYTNSFVAIRPLLAGRWLGVPCIWHIREAHADLGGEACPSFLGKDRLTGWLANFLAKEVIAVSGVASQLAKGHHRLHVIHNGIPESMIDLHLSKESARKRLGWDSSFKIVGVPGTIRKMKGHSFLVRSIAPLLLHDPQVKLAITGSGPAEDVSNLKILVDSLGIKDQVWFTGTLDSMAEFYAAVDISCVPSVVDPFPRVVIESMAAGLPIVATNVGGIPEAIKNQETGILVPYGDQSALRLGIEWCLRNREKSIQMGFRARKHASSRLTNKIYVDSVLNVLKSYLPSLRTML